MDDKSAFLNSFLVDVFNMILRSEEARVCTGEFSDLSISELHVIEAVDLCTKGKNNTASQIATLLNVVPGTLSVAVNALSRKGYLLREKGQLDKRTVHIQLTDRGQGVNALHSRFHQNMVADILEILSPQEAEIMCRGLGGVCEYFKKHVNQED